MLTLTFKNMKIFISRFKKNGICLTLLLVFAAIAANAQQPFVYNQYMDNLTPINPAYSLLQKGGSINTLVHKQWVGIQGAPTTYLVNGSIPIESINATAGLMASNDVVAIEHLNEVNLFFAKGIRLSEKGALAVSINAGFRNYVARYSEVDSSDPTFANDVRETKPNVGFGVMYYSDFYYIGLSVPEFSIRDLGTASAQDNNNFKNHYYLSGGIATEINDDFKFKYAGLVYYAKGVPMSAQVSGMFYIKSTLGLGVNYQTDNEVAGILSLNFNKLHFGYSYQFGTTSVNVAGFHNGTNEVTLGLRFGKTGTDKNN
jgi:type IX secretion system PorP/SprF family membrane protein